jgi:hypothetical protein
MLARELIMKARNAVFALVVGAVSSVGSGNVSAGFINGNFATGDLTGWTASAVDQNGNPVTPLISVASSGGSNFAVLDTGNYATGPFDSTLSQSFLVTAAEPILSFDFNHLHTLTPDPTGTGTSSFRDSFVASLSDGTNTFALLLVDSSGALTDPFGTAPGSVTVGPSSIIPVLDTTLRADLSSLAGQTLTLFLDVTNADDGFRTVFDPTKFDTSAKSPSNFIPEPSSLVLAAIGFVISLFYTWKSHQQAAQQVGEKIGVSSFFRQGKKSVSVLFSASGKKSVSVLFSAREGLSA